MTLHFQNPWLLMGLFAVSLPWLLRWYQTRNARTILWGAMQFLEETLVKEAARMRMQDRLQLLVRMGIVAATALAMAKPVWAPRQANSPVSGQPYILLLFDDSYSMQLRDAERLQFQVAQQQAIQWMDGQHPQTHYSVLTFSDVARLGEHITGVAVYADAGSAQKALRQLRPSLRADTFAELVPALRELLRTRAEPVKQVCVFTDGQRYAWQDARLNALAPDAKLMLILPTKRTIENLGIADLKSDRSVYAVGEPVQLNCTVRNTGTGGDAQTWVKLSVQLGPGGNSQTVANLHSEVKASATYKLRHTQIFSEPGVYVVTASLSPDDLLVDNKRFLLIEVVPSFRVLFIGPHSLYLRTALAPEDKGPIEVLSAGDIPTSLSPMMSERGGLAWTPGSYSAVVLTRPWSLTEARILGDYLRGGGVVWLVLGPEFHQQVEQDLPWLPARLVEPITQARELGAAHIEGSWQWRVQMGSRVLLADSLGNPIALEKEYERGVCIMVGTTPGPPWNDWHIQPDFLPWLHQTLRAAWDRVHRFSIFEIGRIPSGESSAREQVVDVWSTEVGVHWVSQAGAYVLNPLADEGDLHTLPLVWFWQHWPEVEAYISANDQFSFVRQSYPLWPWMWGMALCLACYEVWLSRLRPPEPHTESDD